MFDCSLLTPKELSRETGWSEKRIRNLIQAKQIKFLKCGASYLLPKDAVEDFIRRNMIEPEANTIS